MRQRRPAPRRRSDCHAIPLICLRRLHHRFAAAADADAAVTPPPARARADFATPQPVVTTLRFRCRCRCSDVTQKRWRQHVSAFYEEASDAESAARRRMSRGSRSHTAKSVARRADTRVLMPRFRAAQRRDDTSRTMPVFSFTLPRRHAMSDRRRRQQPGVDACVRERLRSERMLF